VDHEYEWIRWVFGVFVLICTAVLGYLAKRIGDVANTVRNHANDDHRHITNGMSAAVLEQYFKNVELKISMVGKEMVSKIEVVKHSLESHVEWESDWRASLEKKIEKLGSSND
jgi:hypothetical protein